MLLYFIFLPCESMYIVYSKSPDTDIFWNNRNIDIVGIYSTSKEASTVCEEFARNYIHKQTESGYKYRLENSDTYVITKTTIEVMSSLWGSYTTIKHFDIISFHIIEFEHDMTFTKEEKIIVKKKESIPNIRNLLIDELKIKLSQRVIS